VPAVLATTALLLTAGCSSGDGGGGSASDDQKPPASTTANSSPSRQPAEQAPPAKGSVKVLRTVTTDLDTPWGVAPLPDDSGLLGIALSPDYASDHMIYAYFSSGSDNRIARMLYDTRKPAGEQLGAPDTIFKGIPMGYIHNGGRIAFGPDKMLYAGTGESGQQGLAQDKKSLGGKILRLTPEGEPAPGNPFPNSPVYTYGHRNVQGLAWDDKQRLFASEFGQDTWDELNVIKPGGNYGWPDAEGKSSGSKFQNPIAQWHTDDASPSGIAYAEGSIWMAGLKGERLWRIPLKGTKASAAPQAFLSGTYGRLRTVVSAGGDKLWLTTSNTDGRGNPKSGDDRILELQVK
jgi:glucose/arabinose dehydrogenase